MKHLIKSNSTLNNYNFGIKNNIINKAIKLSNESQIIENRKNFTINFNLNQKTFNFSNMKTEIKFEDKLYSCEIKIADKESMTIEIFEKAF